jgi:acetylglutamate kinase
VIRATPLGFSFAGLCAGIKVRRPDLGLVVSSRPATAAGRFTTSRGRAASVAWSAARVPSSGVRAIVVASGNANCMNGSREAADVESMARGVGSAIGVAPDSVLVATTGAIGIPFPIDKVTTAIPALVAALAEDPGPAAEAVRTTDTFTKTASREIFLGGTPVRIFGIAKGSGMVHPRMATVLGFLLTDADVAPACLDEALRAASAESFEMTTVDRETSTNDAVVALANGASGAPRIDDLTSDAGRAFAAALRDLSIELATMVARDGEGARRLVTVEVRGASTTLAARALARAVVGSNLVKAALFGADPAFGRVLAAVGAAASEADLAIEPRACTIAMQGLVLFQGGAPAEVDRDAARALLRRDEVAIEIDLGEGGPARATAFGCDLSYDYVRINADYAAVLADDAGGAVRRDARLETKTPELKADLLVAALGYIERFAGTRAVVRYGPATTGRPELVERLAGDVRLLQAVGLSVILLQAEGDSEAMVTALGRAGTRSVGLSGADGNLLRARSPRFAGGSVPQVPSVDPDVIETLLAKGYVPVVCASWALAAPIPSLAPSGGAGGGRDATLDPDAIAAEIAIACGAKKLLFLSEGPGLLVQGELVSVIGADELAARARDGAIDPDLSGRMRAVVRALSGGVETVHLIDERVPHNVVAELFTDTGVGTMVR